MATEFRKNHGRWHWCPECPGWPQGETESTTALSSETPQSELCTECRELELRQRCTHLE